MSDILVILDYDDTIIHRDGHTENLNLLCDFKKNEVEFSLASRNHHYHVVRGLQKLDILDIFTYIMADFRPKSYQVRHILSNYENEGFDFNKVYFVDDYLPNIERVRKDEPSVSTIHFGIEASSFEDVFSRIGLI